MFKGAYNNNRTVSECGKPMLLFILESYQRGIFLYGNPLRILVRMIHKNMLEHKPKIRNGYASDF